MGRGNSLYGTYIDIALNAYRKYSVYEDIYDDEQDSLFKHEQEGYINIDKYFLNEKVQYAGFDEYLKGVVFIGMAIESYIFDIACIELGDNYVKKHLDKLSVEDKWIIIPQLISGESVDKTQEWFCLLKKIIKARNSFIHSKSVRIDSHEDIERFMENKKPYNANINFKDAIKLIYLISEFVQKLPNTNNYLPFMVLCNDTLITNNDHWKDKLEYKYYCELFKSH